LFVPNLDIKLVQLVGLFGKFKILWCMTVLSEPDGSVQSVDPGIG